MRAQELRLMITVGFATLIAYSLATFAIHTLTTLAHSIGA